MSRKRAGMRTMFTFRESASPHTPLRFRLASRIPTYSGMDACPNCGCRLAGDPSWCPRCLSRFDRVDSADRTAAARDFAAVWGSVKADTADQAPAETVSRPPSMYTPYTPPPSPEPNPALATRESATDTPPPPARKTQIPTTVVGAILMGVVLQAVSYALTKGLHLQPPTAVAL